MSPRVGVADARREQVMQAALHALVENGYCRLPVKEIAREAGVSTGVLYHYFRNKDDILIQSLAAAFADTDRALRQQVDEASAGAGRVHAYLQRAAKLGREDPTTVRVLMNALGQAGYSEAIGSRLARLFAGFRSYAAQTLREGLAEEGANVAPERVENLAALIVAVGIGLSLQWALEPGAVDLDGCGAELAALYGATVAIESDAQGGDDHA